jgi:hypothetical protein
VEEGSVEELLPDQESHGVGSDRRPLEVKLYLDVTARRFHPQRVALLRIQLLIFGLAVLLLLRPRRLRYLGAARDVLLNRDGYEGVLTASSRGGLRSGRGLHHVQNRKNDRGYRGEGPQQDPKSLAAAAAEVGLYLGSAGVPALLLPAAFLRPAAGHGWEVCTRYGRGAGSSRPRSARFIICLLERATH